MQHMSGLVMSEVSAIHWGSWKVDPWIRGTSIILFCVFVGVYMHFILIHQLISVNAEIPCYFSLCLQIQSQVHSNVCTCRP